MRTWWIAFVAAVFIASCSSDLESTPSTPPTTIVSVSTTVAATTTADGATTTTKPEPPPTVYCAIGYRPDNTAVGGEERTLVVHLGEELITAEFADMKVQVSYSFFEGPDVTVVVFDSEQNAISLVEYGEPPANVRIFTPVQIMVIDGDSMITYECGTAPR